MIKSKPVIGIIAKHKKTDNIRTDSLIRDEVKQAIFDNGGIAIGLLSPYEEILYIDDDNENEEFELDKQYLIEQITLCDGIILQGGSESEKFEPFVAKYCYDNNIPCLGICAGQNQIVRGLGGNIKRISNYESHFKPKDTYVHNIRVIDLDSKFYSFIKKDEFSVNSRHKNVVDKNPLLDVVAICEDGYADVVESKDKDFYIGVRFHPESLYKIDENHNMIFKKFVEICKRKKEN